jgi:guanylate kinase
VNGRDYHFLDRSDFQKRLDAGDFLEHATVHGNFYGSLKSEVLSYLESGVDVVMDIDVQGADQVRACEQAEIRRSFADLFVMPPSEVELRARLSARGTDADEVIELRMKNALGEMKHWPKYQYLLSSAGREEDFRRFHALIVAERMRVSRLR